MEAWKTLHFTLLLYSYAWECLKMNLFIKTPPVCGGHRGDSSEYKGLQTKLEYSRKLF